MSHTTRKLPDFHRQNHFREVPNITKLPTIDKFQGLHTTIHQDALLGPIRLNGTRNTSHVTALTGNNLSGNGEDLQSLLIVIYENSDECKVSHVGCPLCISKVEAHIWCIINSLASVTIKSPWQAGLTFKKVPETSLRNLNQVIQKYGMNKTIEEGGLRGACKLATLKREHVQPCCVNPRAHR